MIRSQGARDVALGAGALVSLLRGRDARGWMAAHAFADAADAVATWLARERLPRSTARVATGIAAGSTVVALVGAAATRPREG